MISTSEALSRPATWAEPTTPRILVIIPAKDESGSLPGLLAELAPVHPATDTLVVDDGSNDETRAIAITGGCRTVRHHVNLGYGAALLTGYHFAMREGYTHVVQLDGDGQHPPHAIEALLGPLREDGADVVVGSRYLASNQGQNWGLRRFASKIIAWFASTWTGHKITDPTSGFQALSPAALALLCSDGFPEDYPDADVLIWLHLNGMRLHEVPVAMRPRVAGVSMHGGMRVAYYFYRLAVCLLLLPVRRHSPWRSERRR
ncbi:MAG: glycosyl transferase family 2 [Planctomycetes bacterium]|jgi:glycosyltransferase involved in cell wall biosynthesis|nr:glycosyl transferase family 2 [Planctomycetota bacterium]